VSTVEQALACNGGFSPRLPTFPGAGPFVVLRPWRQPGYNRIVLDMSGHFGDFLRSPHPPVVRFGLPEGLPSLANNHVRFSRCTALNSPQHFRGRDEGPNQKMDMVRHGDPRVEFAEPIPVRRSPDLRRNQVRQFRPLQPHRSDTRRVEIAVHPNERVACGRMVGGRVPAFAQTAVQRPRNEQHSICWPPVGKASAGDVHSHFWCGESGKFLTRGLKPSLQAKACSTQATEVS